MIVVMKSGATEGQILTVQKRIRELGFKDHLSRGDERTVIGVLGTIYRQSDRYNPADDEPKPEKQEEA